MRALVTGAASGIGRATCVRIASDAAARGAQAQLTAVDVQTGPALDDLTDELTQLGAVVSTVAADLAAVDGPQVCVAHAVDRFGGLDAIVSCAGINRAQSLLEFSVDDWDRMFAVNTRATWLLAKAAQPALQESRGSLVAVGSISASNPHAGLGNYGPSKAALVMLVKVLAQELGPDGVRVNSVSPGMTKTGMTARVHADPELAALRAKLVPLGHVAEPEQMASAIAFLLSPDASFVTGHDLVVDGGFTGTLLSRMPGVSLIGPT